MSAHACTDEVRRRMQQQQAYGMQPGMPGMAGMGMPGMPPLAYAHPGMQPLQYPSLQYADPRNAYGQQYMAHAIGAMSLAPTGGGTFSFPTVLPTADAHVELAQQQQQQHLQQQPPRTIRNENK